ILFVDSDDLLLPDRVAAARRMLGQADGFACALDIADENARDLGVKFGPEPAVSLRDLQIRHNVFGMSNTGYRSDLLRRCLPLPATCMLPDWLIATRALAAGADLRFDFTPRMIYRQYGANVARVIKPFGARTVVRSVERVLNHYACILS